VPELKKSEADSEEERETRPEEAGRREKGPSRSHPKEKDTHTDLLQV
jgi:hypothetical protein